VATASEALAAVAARLRYRDVPAQVSTKAKRHLLDLIGVALASSTMPFARQALDAAIQLGGPGDATVIGCAERLPPAWAALVNGTMAHGLDFDDTHQGAVVHVSASVVPAALAAAEETQVDGKAFLTALTLGMETAVRIGMVTGSAFHDRGFHPTGICGAFASTLVAGKLFDLDESKLANALGLCGSMASGSMEFLTDGTWVKRMHPGWAAHAGLVAARFAGCGFSGPRAVFDGRFGLYRSHLGGDHWNLAPLTRDLGERWEMLDIALKPYPCCHFNHAFIDCAKRAMSSPGWRVDTIERIDCHLDAHQIPVVGEPEENKRAPQSDYDAKFSLPYAVACMLVRGHVDVDDFTEASIRDPDVLRLTARTFCHGGHVPDFPRYFPARLRITWSDGRSEELHEPINRGSVERPLSDDEVRDKFRRNAGRVLSATTVEELMGRIERLDDAPNVRGLARSCTIGPATGRKAAVQ
jgi:2-methylcitrate dehydratase PrpD